MNIEIDNRNIVTVAADSDRLAELVRSAFENAEILKKRARFVDIARINVKSIINPNRGKTERAIVILSDAEQQPRYAGESKVDERFDATYHLLFVEKGTHPDRIAQWMSEAKIRTAKRLHVVQYSKDDAADLTDLLVRLTHVGDRRPGRERIIDASLSGAELLVTNSRWESLFVPIASIAALKRMPAESLGKFEIDPDGSYLYWPESDIHLGWQQLQQAVNPEQVLKAQQRSEDFNRRYGAAIRAVREADGLLQSQIDGLTDRQLRRIERGECRATASALRSLAQAHREPANAYLDRLARAMK